MACADESPHVAEFNALCGMAPAASDEAYHGLMRPPNWGRLGCLSDKKSTGWLPEADRFDHSDRRDDAASVDVSKWDVATIDEIDAKQRGCVKTWAD